MSRPPIRPFEFNPADNPALFTEPAAEPPPQPEPEAEAEIIVDGQPRRGGLRRWIWPMMGIGIAGLLALQAWLFIQTLLLANPFIGVAAALFFSLIAIAILGLFWRELSDLSAMQTRARIRDDAARLSTSELHGEAGPLLEEINERLEKAPRSKALVQKFASRSSDSLSDSESLALYERTVLEPLDRRAYRITMESSRDIGLLTALSPLGLLDGLLVLWRSIIMLRQISQLYGLSLGPTATWRLLRTCVRNAVIAGVADAVSHGALEHVGASITAILSARAGQGAGNALLSARLGLEAIKQSRPLPYLTLEPPRMKQIRAAIFDNDSKMPSARKI